MRRPLCLLYVRSSSIDIHNPIIYLSPSMRNIYGKEVVTQSLLYQAHCFELLLLRYIRRPVIIAVYKPAKQRAPDKIEFFFRERVQSVADIIRDVASKLL